MAAEPGDFTYRKLGPERVLLANNDSNSLSPMANQGYYDTYRDDVGSDQQPYYWYHDEVSKPTTGSAYTRLNLMQGTHHEFWRRKVGDEVSDTELWVLDQCRMGSAHDSSSTRCWIPWSSTCQPIDSSRAAAPIPATYTSGSQESKLGGMRQVATIVMRCVKDASITSPFYEDGIGDVYFDAVNGFTSVTSDRIRLEVARVDKNGADIDENTPKASYKWEAWPCDVYEVRRQVSTVPILPEGNAGVTDIRLKSTVSGGNLFYRIHAKVDCRKPCRFRIRRVTVAAGANAPDYSALILVDNVVASYPATTVMPEMYGAYDSRRTGKEAVGWGGSFATPFPAANSSNAQPRVKLSYTTATYPAGSGVEARAEVSEATFHYRWRYLDQIVNDWAEMRADGMATFEGGAGPSGITWPTLGAVTNGPGDVEFYYTIKVNGTHYLPVDYAFSEGWEVGHGPDAYADQTLTLRNGDGEETAACGTEMFTRLREGESDWESFRLFAYVVDPDGKTNVNYSVSDVEMELTANHTWRGFLPTPRALAGRGSAMEFRVIGYNRQTPGWEQGYESNSNVWYASYVPGGYISADQLPFSAFASTNDSMTQIAIDAQTGYLQIEFNDEHASYTLMHASYQNFNTWTDAAIDGGFVGNNAQTSGVSGVKTTWRQDFLGWPLSTPSSGFWWENFDSLRTIEVERENWDTPNGWLGINGAFVNGKWVAYTNMTSQGLAWRMMGNSRGGLEYSNTMRLPNGLDSVSFAARLAQPIEFTDFSYSFRSLTDTNYVVLTKGTLTTKGKRTVDYAEHSPSLSLVAYYRPGKGAYELRLTRVYSDIVQLDIYRWSPSGAAIRPTLLASTRCSSNAHYSEINQSYGNTLGTRLRHYPDCCTVSVNAQGTVTKTQTQAHQDNPASGYAWISDFLSPTDDVEGDATEKWPSLYFGVFNGKGSADQDVTYLEGGFSGAVSQTTPDVDLKNKKMVAIAFEDTGPLRHTRGSFGVGSCDCPAKFGHILQLPATGKVWWKGENADYTVLNATKTQIESDIADGNWTCPLGRQQTFNYTDGSHSFAYGVESLVPQQVVRLLYLQGQAWNESGYSTDMLKSDGTTYPAFSFNTNNYVFTPRVGTVQQFRLMTSGGADDLRTDVVIDNVRFTQWAGDTEVNAGDQLNVQTQKWAYTSGWLTGATNVVTTIEGANTNDDETAYIIGDCQRLRFGNEYVYVFTNAATFVPKADVQILEALVVGGGGAGGTTLGGGGGGGQVVDYTPQGKYVTAGERLDVVVGAGGSPYNGGAATKNVSGVNVRYPAGDYANEWGRGGNGGTSYLRYTAFGKAQETLVTAGGGGGGGAGTRHNRDRQAGDGWTSDSSVTGGGGGSAWTNALNRLGMLTRTKLGNTSNYITNYLASCGGGAAFGPWSLADNGGGAGGGGAGWVSPELIEDANSGRVRRVSDGGDGGETVAGAGGKGYDSGITGTHRIYGSGGGAGAGTYTNGMTMARVYNPGEGGINAGSGGRGGLPSSADLVNTTNGQGLPGVDGFGGGGGGGGAYNAQNGWPSADLGNTTVQTKMNQWGACGGKGGCGTVILRVRPSTRYCLFQPMRGSLAEPMSVRTPMLYGLSMFAFGWRNADEHARLLVQMATNGVNGSTIRNLTLSKEHDVGDSPWRTVATVDFSDMPQGERERGYTNFFFGLRAPYHAGVFRLLMDPDLVDEAVEHRDSYDPAWASVTLTSVQAWDEPALTPYDWWGWNLRTAFNTRLMYLPDASYSPMGLGCTLNFSCSPDDVGHPDNDPEFTKEWPVADALWTLHDPFVQTPVMADVKGHGNIGQLSFRARKYGSLTQSTSSWVTVSVAESASALDEQWVVKTNFEVTGNTFQKFVWRLGSDDSKYQALRLSVEGAKEGRGDPPRQRVLIDEVTVAEPMQPRLALRDVGVFRHHTDDTEAIPPEDLLGQDEQPLIGESFGVQATIAVQQLEDELDKDSMRVFVSYFTGVSPWGYPNWRTHPDAVLDMELPVSSDNPYVFRSSASDPGSFIPPQLLNESKGYTVFQYQVRVTYRDKSGTELSSIVAQSDWALPEWYHPLDLNKQYGQNKESAFSLYSVLDVIAPRRAWVNELNIIEQIVNNMETDPKHEYLELAVPQGYDLKNWSVELYQTPTAPTSLTLATLGAKGGDGKPIATSRSSYPVGGYSFLTLQSPETANDGRIAADKVDGTWVKPSSTPAGACITKDGTIQFNNSFGVRLRRANGIIEHEVVFCPTNTRTGRTAYQYDGTNFCAVLRAREPLSSWFYAGAENTDGSLGVYTNHGESAACWAGDMVCTPGEVNRFRNGEEQYIDPDYFEPPTGTNMWLYASIGPSSEGHLSMTIGKKTGQTTAVIIVPQRPDGTYATNITYQLQPWFEMKQVTTNGVAVTEGVAGQSGTYVFEIKDLTFGAEETKRLEVVADAVISHKVTDADMDEDDPYYPAVVDWILQLPEGDIHQAEFCDLNGNDPRPMSIREMYWLDINPTESNWQFRAAVGNLPPDPGGLNPATNLAVRTVVNSNHLHSGGWSVYTNVVIDVTMFITNTATGEVHAPQTLRGLEPGSVSSNWTAGSSSSWTSVTFKVTGALQTHKDTSDTTYLPLRLFVFDGDSFDDRYRATIEIRDPHLSSSPTYTQHWYEFPWADVFYSWAIDERRIPQQVEVLKSDSTYEPTRP